MADEENMNVETAQPPTVPAETQDTGTQAPTDTQVQTPEPPAFDPKQSYEQVMAELAKRDEVLNNLRRELGQSRGVQSRLDKLIAAMSGQNKDTTPEVVRSLAPDQLQQTEQLLDYFFQKKYGQKIDQLSEAQQNLLVNSRSSSFEAAARGVLGEEFKNLEPHMASFVAEQTRLASSGDQKADKFLDFLAEFPEEGAEYLATIARGRYAKTLQAKSQQATDAQRAKGANAANAVPSNGKQATPIDPKKLSLDEMRAMAEKELQAHK